MESKITYRRKNKHKIDYITFVSVVRNENHTYSKKQGKPSHSIIFVEDGEIEYTFLKTKKTIKFGSGSILFIPKKYPYVARYTKDGTVNNVITFALDAESSLPLLKAPIFTRNDDISGIMKTINRENSNDAFFLTAKTYEILYHLGKKTSSVPDKYKKLLPAINEIQKKYFENKKISFYSDLCGMSESNFRKLFRECMGKSFIEYRNKIRIKEAKKLIDSGECTVAEAAYITGFNNMSFFYECVNKY